MPRTKPIGRSRLLTTKHFVGIRAKDSVGAQRRHEFSVPEIRDQYHASVLWAIYNLMLGEDPLSQQELTAHWHRRSMPNRAVRQV